MANLNKVMLIGRLTRDPESRTFSTGGKVTKLGFAVNNSRRNRETGSWEDEPVFLDVDIWNRGETNKMADRAEQLHKGQQIFIEGHLRLEQWTSQDGQKRSKISVQCDNFQFLDPRSDGGEGGGRFTARPSANTGAGMSAPSRAPAYEAEPAATNAAEEEIPF